MKYYRILVAMIVSVLFTAANAGEIYLDSSVGNWQSVVDSAPKNATFVIKSGVVHRNQSIIPRDGDTFIGEKGAIMSGAIVLDHWNEQTITIVSDGETTAEKQVWVHQLTRIIKPGLKHGDCSELNEAEKMEGESNVQASIRLNLPCVFPQELFVTKFGEQEPIVLQRVRELKDVNQSGEWFLDYKNEVVYMSLDKFDIANDMVELSKTEFAFGYNTTGVEGQYNPEYAQETKLPANPAAPALDIYSRRDQYATKPRNVTIKNLIIEKYANPAQTGAIGYHRPGLDWIIENNEVRYNHGVGIKFKGAAVVRDNYVHDNMQLGIGGGDGNILKAAGGELAEWGYFGGYCGSDGVVENNEIARNGPRDGKENPNPTWGINPRWEGGATKFSQCFNLTVRNNDVHDNYGSGLWADGSYDGGLFESNGVTGSTHEGIVIEITQPSTEIACNEASNNGAFIGDKETVDGGQIMVKNSPSVEIHHNEVVVIQSVDEKTIVGNGITLLNDKEPNIDPAILRVVPPIVPPFQGTNEMRTEKTFVHNNHVTSYADGSCEQNKVRGISGGQNEPDLPSEEKEKFYRPTNNKFKSNYYYVANTDSDKCYWRWDTADSGKDFPPGKTWSQWTEDLHQDEGATLSGTNLVREPDFSGCSRPPGTTIPSPPPEEPTLRGGQGIVEKLYGLENLVPVTSDVDQIWLNHGQAEVTAKATYTNMGRIFGYIDANDQFYQIIELSATQELDEDGIDSGVLPSRDQVPAFRWGIDPAFSSQPSDNSDSADHMLTWLVINGPSKGNYVLAWEDFDDFDFNDLVIEVSNVAPLKQTPVFSSSAERDLLGLEGVLDDLCGLENLARVPDDDDHYWENQGEGLATARARFSGDPSETLEYIDQNSIRHTVFTEDGRETNVLSSGTLPSVEELPRFRWGLEGVFSSKPSDNADGADNMVTWKIIGDDLDHVCEQGNFIIAWEDRELSASDQDYQDMVVEVSGVAPLAQVNDQVVIPPEGIETAYFPDDPRGPDGVFVITATFTNDSSVAINNPFFGVVALSDENTLLNADGGPGAVGVTLTPNVGSDRVLSPEESTTVIFEIGLQKPKRFTFFVDLFEGPNL